VLEYRNPQAPAISEEVQAIRRVLPQPEVFLGKDASEDILRSKGPTSQFIHIATHGHFRQDNPMFSSIRWEIVSESLRSLSAKTSGELMTLSGCSTGLNVVAAGDELIGLRVACCMLEHSLSYSAWGCA